MHGPEIVARTLTATAIDDRFGNQWQYHSRSDRHSKAACWGILFDLMQTSKVLVSHVRSGEVGFGINHEMADFKNSRKKNLDLVLCQPSDVETTNKELRTFLSLVEDYRRERKAVVVVQVPGRTAETSVAPIALPRIME